MDIKRFRSALELDPTFAPYFDAARVEVARMNVQFIEVARIAGAGFEPATFGL